MATFEDYGITLPAGNQGEVYAACPQCSSSRKKKHVKCLSVNTEKGCWICHHCDWRGSLQKGTESKSNPFTWVPKTFVKPQYRPPVTSLPEKVVKWFGERGIPEEILAHNEIGYAEVYMPAVEARVMAIQFPYKRGGEVINVKSRDDNKNFRMESGAERILYGMDDAAEKDTLVICEGEIDKLSLEVAGFLNAVSVPDGAPPADSKNYSSKFDYLNNCKDFIDSFSCFILAVDNDNPGMKLEEELSRRFGTGKCKRVQWPSGCKDANDVLVKHGKERLRECVEQARDFPVEGIFEVSDVNSRIEYIYQNGLESGELTGWKCLDPLYTVKPGEMTIVTGIPSHGKSEFMDAMMINIARKTGWSFGLFSPENYPLELHIAKLAEKYVGKPFHAGLRERMNITEMKDAKLWISRHFYFIAPKEDSLSVDSILALAKILIYRKGIRGLLVDPWNEIDHSRPNVLTETEYISQCLSQFRRFARDHRVHVWIVAHPTKLLKDRDTQKYPVPTPYDIQGSAHWRNKADNCLSVYRPDMMADGVQVHVQKIRFKNVGKIGVCQLSYDRPTGRFSP